MFDLEQMLKRVLGPESTEIGCDECFEHLDGYVDFELAGHNVDAALPGFRAHLDGCAACREEHDSLYALATSENALDAADGSRSASGWPSTAA